MSEVTAVPLRPVSKGAVTALWIGVALLVVVGLGSAWWMGRGAVAAVAGGQDFLAYNAGRPGVVTTPSHLQYQVLKRGTGPKPASGDIAIIEYKGMLPDGTVFDQTNGKQVPLQVDRVVPGFAEGLKLMPKGSVYRLWLPPELGYGAQAAGPIPANSVLVFDVTLHDVMSVPAGMVLPQGQ